MRRHTFFRWSSLCVFVRRKFVGRMRYGIKWFWWRIHNSPWMKIIANYFHLKLEIRKKRLTSHNSITLKLFHYGAILCIVCTIVVRICRARNKWILVSVMKHSCDSSTTDHSDYCEHNKVSLPHSVSNAFTKFKIDSFIRTSAILLEHSIFGCVTIIIIIIIVFSCVRPI